MVTRGQNYTRFIALKENVLENNNTDKHKRETWKSNKMAIYTLQRISAIFGGRTKGIAVKLSEVYAVMLE